jgi:hypothetical protein
MLIVSILVKCGAQSYGCELRMKNEESTGVMQRRKAKIESRKEAHTLPPHFRMKFVPENPLSSFAAYFLRIRSSEKCLTSYISQLNKILARLLYNASPICVGVEMA